MTTDRADRRERDVVRAFVDLSTELVNDYDMLEMLANLTTHCVSLLDVGSAGLLLADDRGVLQLAAASSERTQQLELFQLQRDEGPCLDCYRDGAAVSVPDLEAEQERWPQFSRAALDAGFKSVHAVPMLLRGDSLGGLGLFGDSVGTLEDDDLDLAQALAHVACVAIVNEKSAADRTTVNTQLQHALTSRIVLEQAKGVIAHSGNLEIDEAFTVLRRYAREHGLKLGAVAADVVSRRLRAETLLKHSRAANNAR
ncbi:GAF and ANTAR domain-containing protein [Nocardioides sp.]|uniref:GAF and ANTAR domain-containing protein n=1 Tax=Nocardioides sp. TaxID=35761 RepID=UPI002C666FB1|nr:GAF and ANTAR domain-containing protein [Nocardioides sp.]HXH79273.1 GAF and ANTAR domain-containing protein [Nocardioides sp.]